MKTFEIEIEKKNPDIFLIVKVGRDGTILNCVQYNYAFNSYEDCTERVKATKKWCDEIEAHFAEIDWETIEAETKAEDWEVGQIKMITDRLNSGGGS